MKTFVSWATLCFCLLSCAGSEPTHSSDTDSLYQKTAIIDKPAVVSARSGLTLRKLPKEDYQQAWLLPYNAIVKVHKQTNVLETHQGIMGKWYHVKYLDKSGYVFGGYLNIGTIMQAPAPDEQAVEKIFDTHMQGVLLRALVNVKHGLILRKLPSTSAESITIIPQSEEVGILKYLKSTEVVEERWGNWCKVRHRQKEGYLFSGFLTFTTAKITNVIGAKLRQKATIKSKMELLIPQGSRVFLLSNKPVTKAIIGGVIGYWYKAAYQRKQGYLFSPNLKIQGY
ncbi:SH3 domain-containing protein [Microscilla marina]|uniref:SH3 domain-containing protein n=1 Tax=Microscilla marina TaxID=1027 RepID=UPI0009E487B6|nr:SH3 domain-containing protein [Microscilla marina]